VKDRKGLPVFGPGGKQIGRVVGIDPNDPTKIQVQINLSGGPLTTAGLVEFEIGIGIMKEVSPDPTVDEALEKGREAFE
jgi:hypothetical protein